MRRGGLSDMEWLWLDARSYGVFASFFLQLCAANAAGKDAPTVGECILYPRILFYPTFLLSKVTGPDLTTATS